MRDRVPAKPNRYAVYDDNHNFVRYEYHERADEPAQAGDALNKANLLPDAVATALGLSGNPQVKDALTALQSLANEKAQIATGSYTGTGTFGSENPNSYTFSSVPKLVLIARSTWYKVGVGSSASSINWGPTFQVIIPGFALETYSASYGRTTTSLVGNTLVWYNDNDAASQMNANTYQYTVIGVTV